MNIYRICAIGHRHIFDDRALESKLNTVLKDCFQHQNCIEAYIGRNGDFDIEFARSFRKVAKIMSSGDYKLTLVLPYHVRDEEFYENYYDDILFPLSLHTHYKTAILQRNKWMVDNSDLLICYVNTNSGGAYQTLCYARRQAKKIVNLADIW